jgi:hypothetical protein
MRFAWPTPQLLVAVRSGPVVVLAGTIHGVAFTRHTHLATNADWRPMRHRLLAWAPNP